MIFDKRVEWDPQKNLKIQEERGISFESIHAAIEAGHLLEVILHTNPKYQHQKILVVDMNGYVVLVPFIEDEKRVFLKTAFPSRKATKTYLTETRRI